MLGDRVQRDQAVSGCGEAGCSVWLRYLGSGNRGAASIHSRASNHPALLTHATLAGWSPRHRNPCLPAKRLVDIGLAPMHRTETDPGSECGWRRTTFEEIRTTRAKFPPNCNRNRNARVSGPWERFRPCFYDKRLRYKLKIRCGDLGNGCILKARPKRRPSAAWQEEPGYYTYYTDTHWGSRTEYVGSLPFACY